MKTAIIYARVSSESDRQNTERQVTDLTGYAQANGLSIKKVFEEHISGAKKNSERPVFQNALTYAKENNIDVILFDELSRCGRSTWEVLESVKYMVDHNNNAFFKKENLFLFDSDGNQSPVTAVIISCLSMSAEFERQNIAHRLNSGRALAISKGIKMGRKEGSVMSKEQKKEKYSKALQYLRKGISVQNAVTLARADGVQISERTLWRLKKEFGL